MKVSKLEIKNILGISHLEISPGSVTVIEGRNNDGISFDRVNEARRVMVAIEIAKLSAGELGLVLADGLECLDSLTFGEFQEQAKASGLQFIVTAVRDTDLTISKRA